MGKGRGFASMDKNRQREIASKGGVEAHKSGNAHEFDKAEAADAGRKGGISVSRNRKHMSEIGRLGGLKRSRTPKPQLSFNVAEGEE